MNPAQPAPAVAALLPAGTVAAELHGTRELSREGALALLSEAERGSLGPCALARLQDFAAGRACAHRALEALGCRGQSLLNGADRAPVWPAGIAGSITHTEGYSAAVVGERSRCGSLGLDAERIEALEERLWPRLGTPAELGRLGRLDATQRRAAAALMFAAKEAFYKAQWPLAGELLAFTDVEIACELPLQGSGAFSVRPQRPLRLATRAEAPAGRFRLDGRLVVAGIAIESLP